MSTDKGKPRVTYGKSTAAPAATSNDLSQATQDALLDDAYKRDIMSNMLISGVGQGLQLGTMLVPTAQDVRNKEELDRLQRLQAQGKLGLTGRERAQAEATMLSPVRALATEDRKRAEGRLATMGNQTSAAGLDRVERQASDRAQQQGLAAGMQISKMHLDKAAQQLNEIEERIAYKAERQKGQREFIAQSLGQVGGIVGEAMASRAVPTLDLSNVPNDQKAEVIDLINEAMRETNPVTRTRQLRMLSQMLDGSSPTTIAIEEGER